MRKKIEGNPESRSFRICPNSQARIVKSSNMPSDFFNPIQGHSFRNYPKTQMKSENNTF